MENLKNKIVELQSRDLKITKTSDSFIINQTKRNEAKTEILEALRADMAVMAEKLKSENPDMIVDIHMTADGLILDFINPSVEDQINEMDAEGVCSERVSIGFNAVFKNLSYDPVLESLIYEEEQSEKAKKREAQEKKKSEDIQRSAEKRAEKARLKEELMNKMLAGK